jgi:hypothetical protein
VPPGGRIAARAQLAANRHRAARSRSGTWASSAAMAAPQSRRSAGSVAVAAASSRAGLAKVLGTRSVDAGGGWPIFALPPAEIAVHPAGEGGRAELYLLCDDVAATVAALQAEGIEIARPVSDQGWGLLTAITLPGGVELGLYQPRHPTAAQPG